MPRPTCRLPGCEQQRAAGVQFCHEDWLAKQPMSVQVTYAERRLLSVPRDLWCIRIPKEEWPEGRRWCSGCQTFVRLRDCPSGGSRCRACNSNAAHARMVEATYGITENEFRRLWRAQRGRCYICQRKVHSKRPAVDHDHRTGEVRGLLCPDNERGCNHAILGNIRGETVEEQIAMVYRLAEYLRNPPARLVLQQIRPA